MNLILFIFIILGVLFLAAILYFFLRKRADYLNKEFIKKSRTPPLDYMRHVGVKCPDYWDYMGKDPNNADRHICKNTYNLSVNDPTNCYTNQGQRETSFPTVKWELRGDDEKLKGAAISEICEWRNKCGNTKNSNASWLGIGEWADCTG